MNRICYEWCNKNINFQPWNAVCVCVFVWFFFVWILWKNKARWQWESFQYKLVHRSHTHNIARYHCDFFASTFLIHCVPFIVRSITIQSAVLLSRAVFFRFLVSPLHQMKTIINMHAKIFMNEFYP